MFYTQQSDLDQCATYLKELLPSWDIRQWEEGFDANWQADYALVWNPPITFFEGQKNLKAVHNLGAGVDKLLNHPHFPKEVPLLKIRDAGMGDWILDYIRYGIIYFERSFDRYQKQQIQKEWIPFGVRTKSNCVIAVLGLGAIGQYVAQSLSKEGYAVKGWSRSLKDIDGVSSFSGEVGLKNCLENSDYLVNLLPSTNQTYQLITIDELSCLNEDAVVINAGRGDTMIEDDLLLALEKGHLKGCLLDVFAQEPLAEDHPFWSMDNVIVTPHIAGPTPLEQALMQVKENFEKLEQGLEVQFVDKALGY